MSELQNKRSLSPSLCNNDQLTKRSCRPLNPAKPLQDCLHCGSPFHKWVECTNKCTHCNGLHENKRCPDLAVERYGPAGFVVSLKTGSLVSESPVAHTTEGATLLLGNRDKSAVANGAPSILASSGSLSATQVNSETETNVVCVLGQTDWMPPGGIAPINGDQAATLVKAGASIGITSEPVINIPNPSDGINPARAAMIATTPMPKPVNLAERDGGGRGPQRTGGNTLPLGPRKPSGASRLATNGAPGGFWCGTNEAPTAPHLPATHFSPYVAQQGAQPAQIPPLPHSTLLLQHNHQQYWVPSNGRDLFLQTGAAPRYATRSQGSNPRPVGTAGHTPRRGKHNKGRGGGKGRQRESGERTRSEKALIWKNLKKQIRTAVNETASGKLPNSSNRAIINAFNLLKPIITGDSQIQDDSDEEAQESAATQARKVDNEDDEDDDESDVVIKTEA